MGLFTTVLKPFAQAAESIKSIDSDWTVVQKIQAGDVKAFDELVKKHREKLYSVIYNLTANNADALDLTQETFIKAFQAIHRFKGQSSFFTWLYKIGYNSTLNYLKKHRHRRYFSFDTLNEEGASSEILNQISIQKSSEKSVLLKELQEKLNESLQLLSDNHRMVVVLHEIEGLGYDEIAEIMNCSEGTVRSRLHYAKEQLKVYLKEYIN
jgi:RNA polymerase sigma-70 factor (ECF subfamily)